MKLLTNEQHTQLLANGRAQRHAIRTNQSALDFIPVAKLFTPDAGGTWLLTELDPEEPDLAFGLCDLGLGAPELGYVRLSELESLRGPMGLPIERDLYFDADSPISAYAAEAHRVGRLVT
jgi:hypothetical protein